VQKEDERDRTGGLIEHGPTYELIILLICLVSRSTPRPNPSTPALLETAVSPPVPASFSAAIRFSGIPHSPKPPTSTVAPSLTSAMASAAVHTRTPGMLPAPDFHRVTASVGASDGGATVARPTPATRTHARAAVPNMVPRLQEEAHNSSYAHPRKGQSREAPPPRQVQSIRPFDVRLTQNYPDD
jgi:hypothetical protein